MLSSKAWMAGNSLHRLLETLIHLAASKMALVTSALGHNASHPGLRRQHLGPNSNSSTWHLSFSSPQSSVIGGILVPSRIRCNRCLRSRAGRISNEHPH
uniref:BGLC n=1 Tax=Arundo donax TaxID=35708 RepID=A0A0A9DHC3_ARUDO